MLAVEDSASVSHGVQRAVSGHSTKRSPATTTNVQQAYEDVKRM
jgi:hypothetical protein